VSVDGLQSVGRDRLLKRIRFEPDEHPIIAQIWGKNPENYYKTAKELAELGFDGIDINMGCPDKTIVKNGCCSALINNRELALEIIEATRKGAGSLPVSVKTRLGFNEVDYTWHELLLKQKLNALTIHGRTKKQMSDVPADWDKIQHIREMRDKLSPDTLLIGNGDVMSRKQGAELAAKHGVDGVMIGRGIFQDLFAFAEHSDWPAHTREERIGLYRAHVEMFADTWLNEERKIHTLNKFCKVYIQNFEGAKELRESLMAAKSTDQLLALLNSN
jgi:tRNA-dihydrouridine synthase